MKIVIVGGVAAGASAAARLRRLDETAEIVLLERGAYISYANCGLPYHLGGVIPARESLLVISQQNFATRFRVDVRTRCEVVAIDPAAKTVTIRRDDEEAVEGYDQLLLATGSTPVMPELPGEDAAKVFKFWTIPDMDGVMKSLAAGARHAVVVGAGFIGIEVAENLRHRGLEVTLVEWTPQVLPTVDTEMSSYLARELAQTGIQLKLGAKVVRFAGGGDSYRAVLDSGEELPADVVVMSVGVKPAGELARQAGLQLGERGHIVVNDRLRTSDPAIFAAGDAVEVADPILGGKIAIPLAGPASKQGRIVADNMAGGDSRYAGSLGTAVIKVGKLACAHVGWSERRLQAAQVAYHKIYTHPASHAGYYPGAAPLHMKLLFAPDGKILGAQIVGAEGVDKQIDVIATAMRAGKSAPELAELELAYAPPFNSAKSPVNFLGMVAGNLLAGLTEVVHADALTPEEWLLDVRETAEHEVGSIPGAHNIPLGELRERLGELDRSRRIVTFCQVGVRGYIAERILKQHGFRCANLSGGYLSWQARQPQLPTPVAAPASAPSLAPIAAASMEVLDVCALACPGPVVRLKKAVDALSAGAAIKILAQESFAPDLANWIQASGNELVAMEMKSDHLEAVVRKAGASGPVAAAQSVEDSAAIILFSNDLDKALAGLIVACGLAAAGSKVSIFFTFWGLSVLRKDPAPGVKKSWIGRLFGFMLPRGANKLALSKMNMGGMGAAMMKDIMARQQVPTLPELLTQARELGVQFIACEMAMNVMGLTREELIEVDSVAGVASFAGLAKKATTTLFI